MDWNLFWNAFGAIGTTIGSLITASAVFIAIKQYRQPLKKIVQVKMTSAISWDTISGRPLDFYCISVKNRGIRSVQINSIYIKGKRKNIWINNMQFNSNVKIDFPVEIKAEENKDFFFEIDIFSNEIKKAVEKKILIKRKKLVIFITDSLGDDYIYKTKFRISSFL